MRILLRVSTVHLFYTHTGITISGGDNLTVGQEGSITCRTNVGVSSIEWRNQLNVVVDTGSGTNLTVLEYEFPLVSDNLLGQEYTCIAIAGNDTYTENVTLKVECM